jgi:DNA-binding transcriptional LysR family regulator
MLDLKRLMIFFEVARQSSFSDAAHALSYSQPAISHHVSRLEQELGVRLFERSSRGDVRLTLAGNVLLIYAENLLTTASNAEAAVAEVVGNRDTRLRLGAFATGAATLLTDGIARLRAHMIGVRLVFTEGEPPETIAALKTRNLDLALLYDDPLHPLAPEEDLEYRYVYDDPILLVMPCGHRLASRPSVRVADLAEEAWIEGAGDETPFSLILSDTCAAAGFEPNVVINSGNYEIVQRMAARGIGIALVPELALTSPDPGIAARRLEPEPWRRVVLALHKTAYRSAAVVALIEAIEHTSHVYAEGRDARLNAIAAA